jgi:hypothetical protein
VRTTSLTKTGKGLVKAAVDFSLIEVTLSVGSQQAKQDCGRRRASDRCWICLSCQAEVQPVGQFVCAVMMCCHVPKMLPFQSELPYVHLQPAGCCLRLKFSFYL